MDEKQDALLKGRRDYRIDFLKAIAIISVVIYHFEAESLPFGYLGVDIFFAISGFLFLKTLTGQMIKQNFHCWNYLKKRICRLLIPVMFCILVSYIIGYCTMLPDSYKNLGRDGMKASLFVNNISLWFQQNDYWNKTNSFSPLMHFWYVSVLLQANVFLACLTALVYHFSHKNIKPVYVVLSVLTVLSFSLFLCPFFSISTKFYMFPFRIFEMTSGWLFYVITTKYAKKYWIKLQSRGAIVFLYLILLVLLIWPGTILSASLKLILIVAATNLLMMYYQAPIRVYSILGGWVSKIGKCSYSIYCCHQIIIAFAFTAFIEEKTFQNTVLVFLLIAISSAWLYFGVEKILKVLSMKHQISIVVLSIVFAVITASFGEYIYLNSGVVRDYPELGIQKEDYLYPNVKKIWPQLAFEYVDVPYQWDQDFVKDDRIKILVIGNSFGRDWANILNETDFSSKMDISYTYSPSEKAFQDIKTRIAEADYIFCVEELGYADNSLGFPDYYFRYIPRNKMYVVGDKNFGLHNELIYRHRKETDYFSKTAIVGENVLERNAKLSKIYGNRFIDILAPLLDSNDRVRVFTDTNRFISWDTRHLSKDGTKYFAKILDLSWLVSS